MLAHVPARGLGMFQRWAERRSNVASPGSSGNRAVATRYHKLAVRYEPTVHIAAINEWLPPHL